MFNEANRSHGFVCLFLIANGALLATGCAAQNDDGDGARAAAGAGASSGATSTKTPASAAAGAASASRETNGSGTGGASGVSIDLNSGMAGTAASTTEVVACTEGIDCTCPPLAVAVIGKPGKWGAASDTPSGADKDTAFQDWLVSSSAGTAKVDNYSERPSITPAFLAPYNVIVLDALSEDSNDGPFWSFDANEVEAMRDWVENKAGGVIALTGYSSDPNEILPANQLIGFAGLSYNADSIFGNTKIDPTLTWCGGSSPITEWVRTDPLVANLSTNVTWVGLQNGRSINAPSDAHVAATTLDAQGKVVNVLVGMPFGKGRVLAYADEWITYTSQWSGEGNPKTDNPTCTGHLPQELYQTAQFWYNMIKWSQPNATCFKIVDKQQPVKLW
jgi:hypothetical protein